MKHIFKNLESGFKRTLRKLTSSQSQWKPVDNGKRSLKNAERKIILYPVKNILQK